jgi:hypothetical protein
MVPTDSGWRSSLTIRHTSFVPAQQAILGLTDKSEYLTNVTGCFGTKPGTVSLYAYSDTRISVQGQGAPTAVAKNRNHSHAPQTQSAFMIDLNQVSLALRNCTSRSLIILDEFGKGTLPSGAPPCSPRDPR